MSFMSQSVFRSAPSFLHTSTYLKWIRNVEAKKAQFLRNLGIFNLIQLYKTRLDYDENLLQAAMHFWESYHAAQMLHANPHLIRRRMDFPRLVKLMTLIERVKRNSNLAQLPMVHLWMNILTKTPLKFLTKSTLLFLLSSYAIMFFVPAPSK